MAVESKAKTLTLDNVCKSFAREKGEMMEVLRNINFQAEAGGITCVIGPSGSGKTTLLNIISGIETPDSGTVRIGSESESVRPIIGYVFQTPRLLPWRTVGDNLIFAMRGMGVPQSQWEQRLHDYLSMVGLFEYRNQYPLYLSGGMQQRIGLARAFAVGPTLVLMDEPFSSIDELTAVPLREETLRLNDQLQQTTLFVTHNLMEAAFLGTQVVILSAKPAQVVAAIKNPNPAGSLVWGSVEHARFTDQLREYLKS